MSAAIDQEFLGLISANTRLLQKVCGVYAQDAEDRRDLFSEMVLQAWRSFAGFRGAAKESTWLYRIALNTAISHQRRAAARPRIAAGEEALLQIADAGAADSDAFRQLREVIGQLPPLERALLLLHLEDRSHAEIADIMGITVSNVGTRLSRIREKLRRLMGTER